MIDPRPEARVASEQLAQSPSACCVRYGVLSSGSSQQVASLRVLSGLIILTPQSSKYLAVRLLNADGNQKGYVRFSKCFAHLTRRFYQWSYPMRGSTITSERGSQLVRSSRHLLLCSVSSLVCPLLFIELSAVAACNSCVPSRPHLSIHGSCDRFVQSHA